MITADGFVRIHIGGPPNSLGSQGSAQFIGQVVADKTQASGTGLIFGQGCGAFVTSRFCAETASSEISVTLTVDEGSISGDIEVAMSSGNETWQVDMFWPRPQYTLFGYLEPPPPEWMAGTYYEGLAELARDLDTLIILDTSGRFFFQSPSSSCIGNGALTPHLDGAFNVFDVKLTMEVCSGAYAYLNGEFEGLATIFINCPDGDYCTSLIMWLASPEGAESRTAVTLWSTD